MKTGKSGQFTLKEITYGVNVTVYWEETYDENTNKSIISITKLTGTSTKSYYGTYYLGGSISVDGVDIITFDSISKTHYLYWDSGKVGDVRVQNGGTLPPWESAEIEHNDDGDKTISLNVNISGTSPNQSVKWTVTGSESIDLTHIDWCQAYIYDPTFALYKPYVYDGTVWEILPPYVYNGTEWERYGGGSEEDVPVVQTYDPVFANNTWEQVAEACRTRRVPDTWLVGDQKTMTIGGTDYAIDIIGKDHDDYADGSGKAPLTFQLHDCYETKYNIHSNMVSAIAWKDTIMRTKHLPDIISVMPSEVQSAIKNVNKTSYGGTTSDALFLLSEREVFGTESYSSTTNEGTQYEYYANGGSKIKKINTVTDYWWERSKAGVANSYCLVSDQGKSSYTTIVGTYGVSFAFCF